MGPWGQSKARASWDCGTHPGRGGISKGLMDHEERRWAAGKKRLGSSVWQGDQPVFIVCSKSYSVNPVQPTGWLFLEKKFSITLHDCGIFAMFKLKSSKSTQLLRSHCRMMAVGLVLPKNDRTASVSGCVGKR